MNNPNIIWTAVIATVLGLGSLIASLAGNDSLAMSMGLTSITSALLAGRE
jgi:hypothetical protein